MSSAQATAVTTSIVVHAPVEKAFAVFTQDMGGWWPPEHHIIDVPLAQMVLEPRVGGRIYDVGTDGGECQWHTYWPSTRRAVSSSAGTSRCSGRSKRTTPRRARSRSAFIAEEPNRTASSSSTAILTVRRRLGGHARRHRVTRRLGCRTASLRPLGSRRLHCTGGGRGGCHHWRLTTVRGRTRTAQNGTGRPLSCQSSLGAP